MRISISILLFLFFSLCCGLNEFGERCTALAIGKKATKDGSTIVSHGNDCPICDFRLAYVPARNYPTGSKMPVYMAKNDYPRFVGDRAENYHAELLEKYSWTWNQSESMGEIPQVEHTYGYVDGSYGLMNEHQLAIGESTCDARLGLKGIPVRYGGQALFDIAALSRVALERCKTARCAVQTMGDLAVKYGFYGGELPDWINGPMQDDSEGGEALTLADPNEVWIFDISPDDTGKSAVWVAQRVPDEGVHVVTNTFSIGQIDLNDKDNYMASENIFDVAKRNGFWSAESGTPFDFALVYRSPRGHSIRNKTLIDRRRWAVYNKVCPSCKFDPYALHGEDDSDLYFPFSVKPDTPLDIEAVFNLHRDVFQNTPFDMMTAASAGPWGDPYRAIIPRVPPFNNTPEWDKGSFERAVAQLWTSYTTITQSRSWLPDHIGGRLWYGPHAATTSLFVPVYPGATLQSVPSAVAIGSLYRFHPDALYWSVCLTANYMARFYNRLLPNITTAQVSLELQMLAQAEAQEEKAGKESDVTASKQIMNDFQQENTEFALRGWWKLFYELVAYYHDGTYYHPAPIITTRGTAYPAWWVKLIGPEGARYTEYADEHPQPEYQTRPDLERRTTGTVLVSPTPSHSASVEWFPSLFGLIVAFVLGMAARPIWEIFQAERRKKDYTYIN